MKMHLIPPLNSLTRHVVICSTLSGFNYNRQGCSTGRVILMESRRPDLAKWSTNLFGPFVCFNADVYFRDTSHTAGRDGRLILIQALIAGLFVFWWGWLHRLERTDSMGRISEMIKEGWMSDDHLSVLYTIGLWGGILLGMMSFGGWCWKWWCKLVGK